MGITVRIIMAVNVTVNSVRDTIRRVVSFVKWSLAAHVPNPVTAAWSAQTVIIAKRTPNVPIVLLKKVIVNSASKIMDVVTIVPLTTVVHVAVISALNTVTMILNRAITHFVQIWKVKLPMAALAKTHVTSAYRMMIVTIVRKLPNVVNVQ